MHLSQQRESQAKAPGGLMDEQEVPGKTEAVKVVLQRMEARTGSL